MLRKLPSRSLFLLAQPRRYSASLLSERRWAERREERERSDSHLRLQARRARQDEGIQNDGTSQYDGELSLEQRRCISDVSRLGREGKWEDAVACFASFTQPCLALHNAAMDACARCMQLLPAQRIFGEMPAKTRPAYNMLIHLFGRLRRSSEAEAMLREMVASCLAPNATTYGSIISAYGRVGDVVSAMRALDEMRTAGVPANAITYGAALTACSRAGDASSASALLGHMTAARIEPNMVHLNSLINSCSHARDEARAREFFDDLKKRGFKADVVAFTTLMGCQSGSDVLLKSEAILEEMQQEGVSPNSSTYAVLLRAAMDSGNSSRFEELLADLDGRGLPRTHVIELRVRQRQALYKGGVRGSQSGVGTDAAAATAPRGVGAPLPAGWREALDLVSGRLYYWAEADPASTTTWVRPCV